MKFQAIVVSSVLAGTLIVGCGRVLTSSAGKRPSCVQACAQAKECDADVDEDKCVEKCTEDETLSFAGQEAFTKCVGKQDCQPANAAPALACILSEIKDTQPSETGKTFCGTSLDNLSRCQAESAPPGQEPAPRADEAQCAETISLLADEFLQDLNDCLDGTRACQAAQTCLLIEAAARIDLAALQNPQAGDPGLLGLLASLFGGGLTLPGQGDGGSDDSGDGAGGQAPN